MGDSGGSTSLTSATEIQNDGNQSEASEGGSPDSGVGVKKVSEYVP